MRLCSTAGRASTLISRTLAIALIVPALSGAQAAASAGADPLEPYVTCPYTGDFSVASTTRLPGSGVRYRTVQTANGDRRVSLVDGYTIMIAQGMPSFFANMKIERSDASQYATDKDAVIRNLEFAMQMSSTGNALWEHMPYNGFDVYGVSDPTMEGNGPNGIYVLFRDSTQTIVTIYFLGQKPEYRKFKTIEEHDALRDLMLEELTTCANNPAPVVIPNNFSPLRTPADFDGFMGTYYWRPRPDAISYAIGMLGPSGVLQVGQAVGPVTAFFSEVFSANPSRLTEWQQVIDKQPVASKSAMDQAMAWSKSGGVLKLEGRSPQMNDLYWGAFFASGNPTYVKKLLELVPLTDERKDFNLWATGATAKWSLASNARQHTLVVTILEGEKKTADERTRETIAELLTRDPALMKQEMAETLARQRALGKWR